MTQTFVFLTFWMTKYRESFTRTSDPIGKDGTIYALKNTTYFIFEGVPKNILVAHLCPINTWIYIISKLALCIFIFLIAHWHAVIVYFDYFSRFDIVILGEEWKCSLAKFGPIVLPFAGLAKGLIVLDSFMFFFREGSHSNEYFDAFGLTMHGNE